MVLKCLLLKIYAAKRTERQVTMEYVSNMIDLGGCVLPYMGYIGMCSCYECGFQAVCSSIGEIRAFGSRMGYHFSRN